LIHFGFRRSLVFSTFPWLLLVDEEAYWDICFWSIVCLCLSWSLLASASPFSPFCKTQA
jgi:hypothetical protein